MARIHFLEMDRHHDHHQMSLDTTTEHNLGDHGITLNSQDMKMDMDERHDSMTLYFHTNIGNDYVLFKKWKPTTPEEMIWTFIVIFILAVSYEGLKYYREYLLRIWRLYYYLISNVPKTISTDDENYDGIAAREPVPDIRRDIRSQILSLSHISQIFLHMFQCFISYLLMLVFMTYNVYLCIAVIIGAGVGYFLFGWYKQCLIYSEISDFIRLVNVPGTRF